MTNKACVISFERHRLALRLLALAFALTLSMFVLTPRAEAACTVPNQITNGQVADATAIMGNFNALKDCTNAATIESGTYVPTLTAVANVQNLVLWRADYQRIGNRVSGTVVVTGQIVAAATLTKVGITLPVAKDVTDPKQVAGGSRTTSIQPVSGHVTGDSTNDRMEVALVPAGNAGGGFACQADFSYMVDN